MLKMLVCPPSIAFQTLPGSLKSAGRRLLVSSPHQFCHLRCEHPVGIDRASSGALYNVDLVRGRNTWESGNFGEATDVSFRDNRTMAAEESFKRYSTEKLTRRGEGVAIVWFRNDLRVLDNEALLKAWSSSEAVLPVYCVDPRQFGKTRYFGFSKTGELRAQFLLEGLSDLLSNLRQKGLDLLVEFGKPEKILPKLVESTGSHTVYAQKETCSEELLVEKLVKKNLEQISLPLRKSTDGPSKSTKIQHPKLELIWGSTMYHLNDLPFTTAQLPDVYTQFRKGVESKCKIRSTFKLPVSLAPLPKNLDDVKWGNIPTLDELGLHAREQSSLGVMKFVGGETAALNRLHDYFWEKDKLRVYKETRNGMLGADYSTKFSPWLALGFLSPRYIYEEVKRYENERVSNDSTYWVLFELIWRDYFRFVSMKYGNSIFHLEGPRRVKGIQWSQDKNLFEKWKTGSTGYPLIDANMKELMSTGYMSNRGRQIVCSFLVRDMGIDWRMGAEWFETCLLDYDPCSNYGNWTYGAGVGNDPREDRYFSIPKQAKNYDPDGDYVAHWIPELASLPKSKRHAPGQTYLKPVVPLKFSNPGRAQNNRSQTNKLDFSRLEYHSGGRRGGRRGGGQGPSSRF